MKEHGAQLTQNGVNLKAAKEKLQVLKFYKKIIVFSTLLALYVHIIYAFAFNCARSSRRIFFASLSVLQHIQSLIVVVAIAPRTCMSSLSAPFSCDSPQ